MKLSHGTSIGLGAIAALLALFGFVAEDVVEGETRAFDEAVLLALRVPGRPDQPIGPSWLVETARDITALGSYSVLGLLVVALFLYLLLSQMRATAILIVGAVVSGTIVSTVLKNLFDRPRPDLTGVVDVFTPSFPSGHALVSAVTFLTIGAVLAAASKTRPLQIFYVALAIVLTLLVELSRIYLGVHYPTDVLAGWSLGAAWALVWFMAEAMLRNRTRKSLPPKA